MGHQVNFFLIPTDASSLVERLRTLGDLCIIHDRSSEAAPQIVDGVNYVEDGKRRGLFLVQPSLLRQVVMWHVPAQHYRAVDEQQSPIIEFSPCFFDGSVLREGRLYYVDGFYRSDDQWQDKPEGFRKWGKAVLAKSRKALKRHDHWYIGPDAEQWRARGGGQFVTGCGQVVP